MQNLSCAWQQRERLQWLAGLFDAPLTLATPLNTGCLPIINTTLGRWSSSCSRGSARALRRPHSTSEPPQATTGRKAHQTVRHWHSTVRMGRVSTPATLRQLAVDFIVNIGGVLAAASPQVRHSVLDARRQPALPAGATACGLVSRQPQKGQSACRPGSATATVQPDAAPQHVLSETTETNWGACLRFLVKAVHSVL